MQFNDDSTNINDASLDQVVQFNDDDSTNIDDESGMITTIHNINSIIILLIPLYILYY